MTPPVSCTRRECTNRSAAGGGGGVWKRKATSKQQKRGGAPPREQEVNALARGSSISNLGTGLSPRPPLCRSRRQQVRARGPKKRKENGNSEPHRMTTFGEKLFSYDGSTVVAPKLPRTGECRKERKESSRSKREAPRIRPRPGAVPGFFSPERKST